MRQFLYNFRKFMYGRYGVDQLTRGLIVFALILALISTFTGNIAIHLLSYIPILFAIFRALSKDIQRRTKENFIYTQMTAKLKSKAKNLALVMFGTKTHKYYRCSRCKQMIRVPRGKGKICITCPKCRQEFVKRT